MSKIYVDVSMSLDGFMAGPDPGPANPLGVGGEAIHQWIFGLQAFRKNQHGEKGETGRDNDLFMESNDRAGACIMGKTMFTTGEHIWPEDAPFHCPVFVLTREEREPWERKGGTTFYFINEGLYSALDKAKKACGNKDIRISGGANVIQQFLNAGLVDDMTVHIMSVMLGNGIRLFDNIDKTKFTMEIWGTVHSPQVTHLRYELMNKRS